MPKRSSGVPKKARWTATQKAEARRADSAKPTKKPHHRGQAPSDSAPEPRAKKRWKDRADDSAPRSGAGRRDDRTDGGARRGGERGYDGPPRGPRRDDRPRDDRPRDDRSRGYGDRPDRRDDRSRGYADRSDSRDDRRPDDRGDRPERGTRSDRPWQDRRDDRRDDRRGGERRDDRRPGDRYDRGERADRGDRYERPDRGTRSDRPWQDRRDDRRDDRRGGERRDDRRPGDRYDRAERPDRGDRYDRPDRGTRSNRPWQDRRDDDRGERGPRRDGYDSGPRRRPREADQRPARRWEARSGEDLGRPRHRQVAGGDHYAERHRRLDADAGFVGGLSEADTGDTWTKYTAKTVAAPAAVTQDNGFAALGVPERLVERLARDGITEPFPIQAAAIPDALAGRDVLGRGRTGSGKTLAFGLPLLARLAGGKAAPRKPRSLILVPTRELAMQVSDALEPLVHVMGLRHKLVAGGLSYEPQITALARGVDVLVATPGRLSDLVERGAADLSGVEVTVLDEADHMAQMGFLEAMTEILDQVPADGQRLLFSATLDSGVDTLVQRYLTDPVTHSTDDVSAAVTTMSHHVFLLDPRDKKAVTAELANRDGRTVVFVRTKLGADRVAAELRENGVTAAALHGGLTQGARNRVLGAFRTGTLPVLVATDVAARGIHVDDVGVVLQVDPPADHKDYLHRAGRTARAGESGIVITLALPHQRRTMERMLEAAGADTTPTRVQPGDAPIAAAGGSAPSGIPVDERAYRALVEAPARGRRGPGGPRRSDRNDRGGRGFRGSPRGARVREW